VPFFIRRARCSRLACGGGDPVDRISARVGRDFRTHNFLAFGADVRAFSQIWSAPVGSGSAVAGRDLQREQRRPACAPAASAASGSSFEPVAFLAVGLENRFKGEASMVPSIAVMPREEFSTGGLWQDEKGQESALPLSAGRRSFALKRIEVYGSLFAWYH